MNISKMLKFPKTICHHSAKISDHRPEKNTGRRLMWTFARSFTQEGSVRLQSSQHSWITKNFDLDSKICVLDSRKWAAGVWVGQREKDPCILGGKHI
jgi:hypothetical protein